jgi:hypothetical protein
LQLLWRSLVWGDFVWLFVRRRELSDRDYRRLLFVDLGKSDSPGGRFVVAATGGFVEAEGLERSGEGEEEKRWSYEDTCVEVQQSGVFQKRVGRSHSPSFVQKESAYGKLDATCRF